MAGTDAVKNERWIGLRYEELTPRPGQHFRDRKNGQGHASGPVLIGPVRPHITSGGGCSGHPHPVVRALWDHPNSA